jgi:putative Holliday junction resolvase
LVAETEAEVVVVGLPLSMDGSIGPAARRTHKELTQLERSLAVPVESYDERLSTVAANRSLQSAGLDTVRSRQHVDEVAAAVILQAWLDHRRTRRDDSRASRGTTTSEDQT